VTSKADQIRFDKLHRIGCIACRKLGMASQIDIHHMVEGYRLGNKYTLPLCPYHHRGDPPDGISLKLAFKIYGPSLRREKKQFKARFGNERELLDEVDALVVVE
jgi:hypothetical protein